MSKLRIKGPSAIWIVGLCALGLLVTWLFYQQIDSSKHLTTIYVATKTIPVDTAISASDFVSKRISSDTVPSNAVTDPKTIDGKYAASTIYTGQVAVKEAVSDANTVREVVRQYGLNFVGITIQLDQADLSPDLVHAGDTVDLLGVFGQGNNVITSSFIAKDVPVLSVDTKDRKILVAAPETNAPDIAKNLAAGKVRVFLNPQPFGNESFSTNANPSSQDTGGNTHPAVKK